MEEILKQAQFKKMIGELAAKLGQSETAVQHEAESCLEEMYATHNPLADAIGSLASQVIVTRGYDNTIDVVDEELRQVERLMRSRAVAFVITHKTYLDTFVLSTVLAQNMLPIPYTFGGINMAFMGLGQLGRQAGGIFIRRSFKDNEIYKSVLRYYIAHLVRSKASFMWALEGTRSRTGKILWPRLGILKYMVEASRPLPKDSITYIPVSIVYDLIPDVHAMTAEKRGTEKKAESLGWFLNYIRKLMGGNHGRIAVRFGEPASLDETPDVPELESLAQKYTAEQVALQKLSVELVYRINQATPIATTALICTTLLSKFSASQREIELDVSQLEEIVHGRQPNAILSSKRPLHDRVQNALDLLVNDEVVERKGTGLNVSYSVPPASYMMAVYYSNMAIHHLVNHAFMELAILHAADKDASQRQLSFWAEIMRLRDLFKFEFFYSRKPIFSDEIEGELGRLDADWQAKFSDTDGNPVDLLREKQLFVAHAILPPYLEAYRVIAYGLLQRNPEEPFEEAAFIQDCIDLGEELHWQGIIHRVESISKPFLTHGIYLAKNRGLIGPGEHEEGIKKFLRQLEYVGERLQTLQSFTLEREVEFPHPDIEETLAETAVSETVVAEVIDAPEGPQIGAFFDLDRTLIEGFSAREFAQERILSRQMSSREILAQFAGVLVYAIGNRNFASLAAVSAQGVDGTPEAVFAELGEEVFTKHLADKIYPESRALVQAHFAKGHTVAIISAATPYQVEPVARELGIEHVMCTRLEVKNGRFTGKIVDPACWGDGKAVAARELAAKLNLDLDQSYFYTDSAEDMPLLDIVGKPRPLNPDEELDKVALERGWPIQYFHTMRRAGFRSALRTGLALSSMVPIMIAGVSSGVMNFSRQRGINTMVGALGDVGTRLAGIQLRVRGEENMWSHRPAVFIFNHQSGADLLIGAKLLRKDATGIAKRELKYSLMGPLMMAGGMVFIDRGNREKAIAAMEPAVEALKNGRSLAIAPEGTRSKDYTLGPFKKGAFHMAMQAGVPIVPMVIKNAHDALPKGSFLIRKSIVEVVVLPPIPTTDWQVETLDQHIDDVRNLFLQELGQVEEN